MAKRSADVALLSPAGSPPRPLPPASTRAAAALEAAHDLLSKAPPVDASPWFDAMATVVRLLVAVVETNIAPPPIECARDAAAEALEDEARRRSLVIDGLPESTAATPSVRVAEDSGAVTALLDELGVEAQPLAVYRMGKASPTRPRLVKVLLPFSSAQRSALAASKKLKHSAKFGRVFVRPSLSADERRRAFELRQEARERKKNGEDVIVFRDAVIKRSDHPANKMRTAPTSPANPENH